MPDTPITQAGLDRLEGNLRTLVAETKAHILSLRDADREHIERRFTDSITAVDAALNAAKEAVLKAETASEKRFEGVNEFRGTLQDQQRTLWPRIEGEARLSEVTRRIDELVSRVQALEVANVQTVSEAEGSKNLWGYIVGVVGFVLLIAAFALQFVSP